MGRYYGAAFHIQLVLDFAILAPRALARRLAERRGGGSGRVPRGPATADVLADRPIGLLLIVASMVIPYFTLGDDYKLMKQVGFDAVMLFSGLFGLLTASISVNEEIEGRTAITVISKPVSRRQFFIGKYLGILLACWVMMLLLGWVLTWALHIKPRFDPLDDVVDPMPFEVTRWLAPKFDAVVPTVEGTAWARGMGAWTRATRLAHHSGWPGSSAR